MKLNNLKPSAGSTHTSKRLGRGQGSGKGGTSTRGTKGAQARAGYEHKIGFEGGQMPIQRRLPKFGFKNPTRVEYKAVNVSDIEALAAKAGLKEIGVAEIKAAKEKLMESAQKLFTKMYEQAGAGAAGGPNPGAGAGPNPGADAGPAPDGFQGDDVVDGDYKEV